MNIHENINIRSFFSNSRYFIRFYKKEEKGNWGITGEIQYWRALWHHKENRGIKKEKNKENQ